MDGTVSRNLHSTFSMLLSSVAQTPLFCALGMMLARLRAKIMAPAKMHDLLAGALSEQHADNLSGHCESNI
jgi:hypothetical protein